MLVQVKPYPRTFIPADVVRCVEQDGRRVTVTDVTDHAYVTTFHNLPSATRFTNGLLKEFNPDFEYDNLEAAKVYRHRRAVES